ncbi:cytochrome P450 family protein [Ceratobasidium sp. AG-Ba]|nr:cytochrome P450 family protein [Ceratobasidium sp. AG-Ba]
MLSFEDVARTVTNIYAGLLLVALFLAYYWDWPGSRNSKLPPGPRPWPIVGNVLDLKLVDLSGQLRQLHTKYGPIICLKIGTGNLISIAGDGTHIRQLLDKRGSIYSGRPLNMATEIASQGDYLVFQQDHNKWRAARKPIVQHFNPSIVKADYFRIQEAESVQLLYEFLHEPKDFMRHPMRYATSVLTCLVYGIRCENHQDPAICGVEEILRNMTEIGVPGGKPPVEDFPWLNYLPEAILPWRNRCKNLGQAMEKLYNGLAEIGWNRGVEGLNPDNLAYKMRLDEKQNKLSRHEQAFACGILLEAGSDIVAAVILIALLAFVHEPESQQRARAEIDGLYDEDTLPKWRDEQSMPFVRAVVKETIRWRPPLPIAVPHRLEQDDNYNGYLLPKGSTVLCNISAIHLGSERFNEPEKFKPDRFLGDTMSMAESVSQADHFKRDHFGFGAGRVVCPGIQTAEQDIFIALSRLLWAFEFTLPSGVNVEVDAFNGFRGEGLRTPKDFPLTSYGYALV